MDIQCPKCDTQFESILQAELPDETTLTICLQIEPDQLCMAKTVAGVIESFAKIQEAIGESMGMVTDVFIAGLSYENDTISITTRICNRAEKP